MPLIWASGCPCQNELTWRMGAHRKPRAGWRRTAWTSPGSPLTTVTPAADHVLAVDVAAGRQAPAYTETIPDSTAAAGKASRPRSVTP